MSNSPTQTVVQSPPEIRFDHLRRLTGWFGLYEHAQYSRPRYEHGYALDDNARALVLLSRAGSLEPDVLALRDRYLRFVLAGRIHGGWRNRMSHEGLWQDAGGFDDAHGRALWGLGTSAAALMDHERGDVMDGLVAGCDLDSPSPRANAFAVLGVTAAMTVAEPRHVDTLTSALARFTRRVPTEADGPWLWPESRLAYANARIPEALIAAGVALGREDLTASGLKLLEWLVGQEHGEHAFSFTPVGGRGPADERPAFDQQPIEAWAMADACARAAFVTDGDSWAGLVEDAAFWFLGRNDTGAQLYDPATGAGCDGLHADRVNVNQGAESTLSALGALQTYRRLLDGNPPT